MNPVAFLFDRNFPLRVARMVEQYERGRIVVRHQDDDTRFEIDTPDVDIIRILAADIDHRWVLVSQDKRITRRPAERTVLLAAGIKFFYFGKAWAKMSTHIQAWRFVRAWPDLVDVAEHHRGKVFEIEGANLKITPVG
jgi:hypothetical protein